MSARSSSEPLRMRRGLLGGDLALVDQRLHQRVVLGDLEDLAVADQVGPRVADVRQPELGARPQQRGQRGAHAVQRGVGLDHVAQRAVGAADRVVEGVQQLAARHVGVQRPQRLDDGGAGHLAGRVTAHPVGHREQPGSGVRGVLVALTNQSGVGPHRVADGECLLAIVHGCVLSRQVADEEDGELPPGRGFRLDLGPVRGQFGGGLRRAAAR